jgi:periplasmic protein TonB
MSPLLVMLSVSALLHVLLIISISFDIDPSKIFKDKMPALDVVLVNAKTQSAPNKADALAQANLNRGGNTDTKHQMKSSLPPPKERPIEAQLDPTMESKSSQRNAALAEEEAMRQQKRVAELEKQVQDMMTQLKSTQKVETKASQLEAAAKPEKQQQQATTKNVGNSDSKASSLDIARLEAQIAKQQDEYQKYPRRKYVGARTQEYRFAGYVEAWRQKVEKVGNLNYPELAKAQKLYGQLRLTVSIRRDGSIEHIEINHSSGHKILDDAALHIVRAAAPYPPFPANISTDTDVLSITRTWTFTKQENIATE